MYDRLTQSMRLVDTAFLSADNHCLFVKKYLFERILLLNLHKNNASLFNGMFCFAIQSHKLTVMTISDDGRSQSEKCSTYSACWTLGYSDVYVIVLYFIIFISIWLKAKSIAMIFLHVLKRLRLIVVQLNEWFISCGILIQF